MKISDKKKEKISEQILSVLFDSFPKPLFISEISREIARDEEFVKILVQELESKSLVVPINKNNEGIKYQKRVRWRLSNKAQEAYLNHNF
ncbi:MAG TPA: hypothetical protein P5277_03555 [Candidatus Paceibacterota bacterium]|nr:hypothetical protein [Candidatus Paceibacterota bacterium]